MDHLAAIPLANDSGRGSRMRHRIYQWQVPKANAKWDCRSSDAHLCHQPSPRRFTVTSPSPTVRRRELGARLRALRVDRGLTVEDVAERMEVSPAKISRIETAARGISLADVRFLCDLYGVSGADRDRLLVLTRESRRRSWWQQYGLPDSVADLHRPRGRRGLDPPVQDKRRAPLLQTEDYARAYTPAAGPWLSDDEVEQFVQARMTRQELLGSEPPARPVGDHRRRSAASDRRQHADHARAARGADRRQPAPHVTCR